MEYIIVQAGGKGTRLKELTQNKPKALVPVCNLPILFHLFRKYPDKKFIVIADYKKEVLRSYLETFADVAYIVVDTHGTGTCAGLSEAAALLPLKEPFMLIWSDLVLPKHFRLPDEYQKERQPKHNYVGISRDFPCRWSYENNIFTERRSKEHGVAGLFLFTDKTWLSDVPKEGEFTGWLKTQEIDFHTTWLSGAKEFGIYEECVESVKEKCRPFNKITIHEDVLTKEPIDEQGRMLAEYESSWYQKAMKKGICMLPKIYAFHPLKMEYIKGCRMDEGHFSEIQKKQIMQKLILSLQDLHRAETAPADVFSLKETYYYKTFARLLKIQDLVPFAKEPVITVNGKPCQNVLFQKRKLEQRLDGLMQNCGNFCLIHGDSTFSNLMLRDGKDPVLIDPRGYFGFTSFFGDARYDWAKLYYSIVGNYDRFNVKEFCLTIESEEKADVKLTIGSNGWESMEQDFFALTGADPQEIKLIHAIIWLSLTTYAWQDYDSICGAFYNGLYYLEDVL